MVINKSNFIYAMQEGEVAFMMNSFYWGSGFDVGFSIFQVIFTLMFLLIFGVFVVSFIKGISEWNKNNHSPKLIVDATVVAKRGHTTHHHHDNHTSHSTSYYITFQVESGDRMEFLVSDTEFGLLVEGDYGKLSFQGTRYLGFERIY